MPTINKTFKRFILVNFLAWLLSRNLAKGIAITASVATIKIHHVTNLPSPGSLISVAKESENKISRNERPAELARIEISAVEYTRSL